MKHSIFASIYIVSMFASILSAEAIAQPNSKIADDDTVSPDVVCETGSTAQYSVSTTSVYVGNIDERVYGKSGGTLTISKGTTQTWSGSITGTTTAEAGVIFAKASASVGITISSSRTQSLTVGYSWTVPSTQSTGWIEAGNRGYNVKYTKYNYLSPCKYNVLKTGTVKGVTSNVMFTHS